MRGCCRKQAVCRAALDQTAAERKTLCHSRACTVLPEIGHIRVHGRQKRADALVEQVACKDQVERTLGQGGLAQRKPDGGLLQLAFCQLPRALPHAVILRHIVKPLTERAFALFFADCRRVSEQIRSVFERKRALADALYHTEPPPVKNRMRP